MKITFEFNPRHLVLLLPFISTDETRYFINGVLVECTPGQSPLYVATDGRQLATLLIESKHDAKEAASFILPVDFIHHLKGYGGPYFGEPTIECDTETDQVIAKINRMEFRFEAIHGNYPSWRQVIPEAPDPCCLQMDRTIFNPEFLLNAVNFVQEFDSGPADMFGKTGEALVMKTPRAMVVLMPGRSAKAMTFAPFK